MSDFFHYQPSGPVESWGKLLKKYPDYWMRVDDNWKEDAFGGEAVLTLFPVVRITKCGVWIQAYEKQRFVLFAARKRFAYPTIDLAINSFLCRKDRHVKILKSKISRIEDAIQDCRIYQGF